MAGVPQKTLHWLYSVLSKEYRDPNRTYSDLARALENFPTLSPRTDVYTFENGSSALLLHLVGTLPVSFRSTTYRFPLELWIPHAYPYESPIAYITPTDDMLVRPGRHLSAEGKVYHPYLAHWREAWDRSTLPDFLSILCDVFSREPPVMSRQQTINPPPQSSRPPRVPPHLPEQRPESFHASTSSTHPAPPLPPPPPPKRHLETDASGIPKPISTPLGRYDAPPPLPDAAGASASQLVDGRHAVPPGQLPQFVPGRSTSLRQPMPSSLPFQQQQHHPERLVAQPTAFSAPNAPSMTRPPEAGPSYRQSSNFQPISPSSNPAQHGRNSQAVPAQYPPPMPQDHSLSTSYQTQSVSTRQQVQPKPPPVNLLDSPFDIGLPVSSANIPAPPVPPNPQKDALLSALSHSITQTLHHEMSQNATSLPLLRSQNEALNNSLRTLEAELAQLQALQGTVTGNISILQSSLREADQCISSAHASAQRGEISKIDDMLTAPTVVGKQLYDVVCDERGIEAAIWALQAALTRGRISTDLWAKKTRELSREGFRRKVLSRKIAEGIGLEI